MNELPIHAELPRVLDSLTAHPRLVLEAPPGSGKTTQVPLALLAAPWCRGKVIMLEPRRIAARAAATYMARQLREEVGATVGYQIRFERKISRATRIEIVTEGILTRQLQDDPNLEDVSAVLFDEFHERHLASDLGLALCLDVQASLRPDLRLIVMSATLDGARIAEFLQAPRITAEGRSFPVTVQYFAPRPQEPTDAHFKRAVRQALIDTDGDVLCFLPGKPEIDRAQRSLADLEVTLEPLHGEMNITDQARLLAPSSTRRVVLATNVAESSVTLPSVRAVVDTGLAREPAFDPASGMSKLNTVYIAQSSAVQRAGRAGRVAPGICYRLWPESQRLDPATRPELQRIDLSALLLDVKAWGSDTLRFLDTPPPGTMAQARDLLQALDALDAQGRLTAHGRELLSFGIHPRLANAILRAPLNLRPLACDVAALIDARDPLRGEARRNDELRTRLSALQAFRARAAPRDADRGVLAKIDQSSQTWQRRLERAPAARAAFSAHDIGHVLALAYPDRIARREENHSRRYRLSNGRGAQLKMESGLTGEPWLVAAEIRFDERDSLIQQAAPLDFAVLEKDFKTQFTQQNSTQFNPETRAVEVQEQTRFASITLAAQIKPAPRSAHTAEILCRGITDLGLSCLPWTDALREWQARVQCLRQACPELQLPDVSDDALAANLDEWLLPALQTHTRLAHLATQELADALHALLDYPQRRALEEHAPSALRVPSGMQRSLTYREGPSPVLAVKLQEMFGLADTPKIAKGRLSVTLHLLSPRQAPIQVTQDLRGFWERTYPEVKKELKGRYPKHPWPDDPWTATATHRAKPRT